MKPIILASKSPRKIELLTKLGLKFRAVESEYQEDMSLRIGPTDLAKHLSEGKAKAIANRLKNTLSLPLTTLLSSEINYLANHTHPQRLDKCSGRLVVELYQLLLDLQL